MSRKNQHAATIERSDDNFGPPQVSFIGAQPSSQIVTNVTLSDEIAKSRMIIRNVAYKGAREAFPYEPQHQTVERFFPLAEGGPLYVDMAMDPEAEAACQRKLKVMRENKSRYLILRKDIDIFDAMKQLQGK
jgi:hypothetical protein